MEVIPGGIWCMWFLNIGLSFVAIAIARHMNKREKRSGQ